MVVPASPVDEGCLQDGSWEAFNEGVQSALWCLQTKMVFHFWARECKKHFFFFYRQPVTSYNPHAVTTSQSHRFDVPLLTRSCHNPCFPSGKAGAYEYSSRQTFACPFASYRWYRNKLCVIGQSASSTRNLKVSESDVISSSPTKPRENVPQWSEIPDFLIHSGCDCT